MEETLNSVQQCFWSTKQAVIKKLGRKEDKDIVHSDKDLDVKLEYFNDLKSSTKRMLKIFNKYDEVLQNSIKDEEEFSKFLKDKGKQDKSRAGKIMLESGKALAIICDQRTVFRNLFPRMQQETDTFYKKAIKDTSETVERMEKSRTSYRGAILWLNSAVKEFDPEDYYEVEKYRSTQNHVRKTKAAFDKLKLTSLQKIDLLDISRCNLLSHIFVSYQKGFEDFMSSSSHALKMIPPVECEFSRVKAHNTIFIADILRNLDQLPRKKGVELIPMINTKSSPKRHKADPNLLVSPLESSSLNDETVKNKKRLEAIPLKLFPQFEDFEDFENELVQPIDDLPRADDWKMSVNLKDDTLREDDSWYIPEFESDAKKTNSDNFSKVPSRDFLHTHKESNLTIPTLTPEKLPLGPYKNAFYIKDSSLAMEGSVRPKISLTGLDPLLEKDTLSLEGGQGEVKQVLDIFF